MPTLTLADWQQRARDLHIEGRAFIQGGYCAAVDGGQFDCISPVDGRLLAQVASCDQADAERAVASARAVPHSMPAAGRAWHRPSARRC